MRRTAGVLGAVLVLLLVAASPALGAQVAVSVDSREVVLKEAERGWTTVAGITNLQDHEIDLEVPFYLSKPVGCIPRVQDGKLRVGEHREVEIKIPPKCNASGEGFVFYITSATPEGPPFPIEMVAVEDESDAPPPWEWLWLFAAFFGVLAVVGLVYGKRLGNDLGTALEYLGSTWSFKDSWASNVAVAGGLLTGVLGSSEVLTAVLGDGAESATAMATVGAAIGVALVGAAALVLEATQKTVGKADGNAGSDHPRIWGFALASALSLAAAFGEIWVVAISAERLDLGGLESWLPWVLAGLASLLLAAYARRNFKRTIEVGTTAPKKAEATEAGVAAVIEAVAEQRPAAMP